MGCAGKMMPAVAMRRQRSVERRSVRSFMMNSPYSVLAKSGELL